jgi:hypothetical protein
LTPLPLNYPACAISMETELLVHLSNTKNRDDAQRISELLVERHGYSWTPVGGREGNYGLINIGSDPGYAFIERVTNAIDAVIEREAVRHRGKSGGLIVVPSTPREATEQWLGVPAGRTKNLSIRQRQALADNVVVQLHPGSNARTPVVVIRDFGIGITPSAVPHTILSLGESNKIDKPYLAGAYGQGGSTTFAFSPEGTVISSRRQLDLLRTGEEDVVAVTFVRFRELDPSANKNGRYDFLVRPNGQVANFPADLLPEFAPGTAVTHFDLQIQQYAARVTQLTGSMWWLLQNALFDPILPFWVEDLRDVDNVDRRTIVGNHSRLSEDTKDKVEHSDTVLALLADGTGQNRARIHYWVVREPDQTKRSRPIDAYVDPYFPLTYTYFGQTHGAEERRFVTDRLGLPYLDKFLIVQVELDNLTPSARRGLLSTTRDRLKQGALYESLRETIAAALGEDEVLIQLNDARREAILSRHTSAEQEKMRERFARLVDNLRAGVDARVPGKGAGAGGRPTSVSGSREPLEPLATADEPSFINVANAQSPIPLRLKRSALIRLESDAPDGYLTSHAHARLALGSEPSRAVSVVSESDFRGGRARIAVTPQESLKVGTEGTLTVFLFTPTDDQLSASTKFRVVAAETDATAGTSKKANVQAPIPVEIHENEWTAFGWDEKSVAEVKDGSDATRIFVNLDNRHIRRLLAAGGYKETGLARMKTSYLLYVALFAYLQNRNARGSQLIASGPDFEEYVASELDRAAQTVVHSISAAGRLEGE